MWSANQAPPSPHPCSSPIRPRKSEITSRPRSPPQIDVATDCWNCASSRKLGGRVSPRAFRAAHQDARPPLQKSLLGRNLELKIQVLLVAFDLDLLRLRASLLVDRFHRVFAVRQVRNF